MKRSLEAMKAMAPVEDRLISREEMAALRCLTVSRDPRRIVALRKGLRPPGDEELLRQLFTQIREASGDLWNDEGSTDEESTDKPKLEAHPPPITLHRHFERRPVALCSEGA